MPVICLQTEAVY